MKIDVHNHVGYDPAYEITRTAEELVAEMEKNNISRSVVFPFTSNPDAQEGNKIVKEAIDAYPDKLLGFFLMNPRNKDMTDQMYEYKEQGFKRVITDPRFGVDHGTRRLHELVEWIATRHMNVYLDTAGDMSGSMTASKTQPIGTHRILMGSNTPYGMLRREVEKIEEAPELTKFQRSLIFHDNVERLLKL